MASAIPLRNHRKFRSCGLFVWAGSGLCAALLEFPAKAIIVETLVAHQRAEGDAEEQGFDRDAVMALPGQEDEAGSASTRTTILLVKPPRERPIA